MTAARRGVRVLTALLLAAATLLLPASPASAHPLDVYLQAMYLTLAPAAVQVELDLSPGVLVAPRVLAALDADGNQTVSDAEGRVYAEQVLGSVQLSADDTPLTPIIDSVDIPAFPVLQAGYGTVKITASATGAPTAVGEHRVQWRNGSTDTQAAFQVNSFVAPHARLAIGTQQRDAAQRSIAVTYRITDSPAAEVASPTPARRSSAGSQLAGFLDDRSPSVGMVLLALGAAALLGALHALTPGHAKTLMAAYLVGSGGTTRDAALLAGVVTFTHTASVIGIGVIALAASSLVVPEVLVPALELVSGILVVALGLRLLTQRWPRPAVRAAKTPALVGADRTHAHEHEPGDHGHVHAVPQGPVSARSLIALGVSGGLVPCPEALGVLVLAVGVGRTLLGLGMVAAFSVGLAAVLVAVAVLLVRSRSILARAGRLPASWTTALPLISAAVVTVLGALLVVRALS